MRSCSSTSGVSVRPSHTSWISAKWNFWTEIKQNSLRNYAIWKTVQWQVRQNASVAYTLSFCIYLVLYRLPSPSLFVATSSRLMPMNSWTKPTSEIFLVKPFCITWPESDSCLKLTSSFMQASFDMNEWMNEWESNASSGWMKEWMKER